MKFQRLSWAAIVLLIALTYSRAVSNGKVWDDDAYLTEKHLATFEGLKRIWQEPTSTRHPYYPLTRTTLWIENKLWGENLFIHHFVSILIHVFNSLLIWRILNRLNVARPWVAAAIFAVHPVCIESAGWIAERKNVLGVFFYLSSMLAFLKFRLRPNSEEESLGQKKFYYLSLFLFVCSLLSKTAFCTLPLALILIIWWKKGRIRALDIRMVVPFLLVALILGSLTIFLEKHHTGAQGPAFQITFVERCLIAGRAFWFYIGKILFPYEVNFLYPRWEISAGNWRHWVYVLTALSVIGVFWALRNRMGRGPLTAVLFFIISLLPAIGLINHYLMRYTFVADHLQYLPMVGILALIVSTLHKLLRNRLPVSAEIAIWAVVIGALSLLTWRQTGAYKDNFTLYSDILRKNPNCWMALNNRGLIYMEKGDRSKAITDFNTALQLNPQFEEVYISRGHYYFQLGRYDEAFNDFNTAVKINPYLDEAYRNRGAVYFVRQKYSSALADFNRALYLNPKYAAAYNARGAVFSVAKQFDLALQDYNRAIEINPDYGPVYLNRSKTLWELRRFQEALNDAMKARSLGVPGVDPYIQKLRSSSKSAA